MTLQFELDWDSKLPPSAQIGMAQADANANKVWKHIWDGCVLAAARRLPEITSDDVLFEFEQLKNQPMTHNLSAIGPAMRRGWKMGILMPTDKVVRSLREEKRGNYHRTWKSQYYKASQ
jgi:hypothetical protein